MRRAVDPKRVLRELCEDDSGRLPIARSALAAALLDPLNAKPEDDVEGALDYLDRLAADAAGRIRGAAPLAERIAALNGVIVEEAGFAGDEESYDDLANANLFRVIERRRGLPVALGVIYMHVGRAAGLTVDGLAFPGHFLLRVEQDGGRAVIDPFFGGVERDAAGLRDLLKSVEGVAAELSPEHYDAVPDRDVLLRLQNNIKLRLIDTARHGEAAQVVESMVMLRPGDAALWRETGLLHARAGNLRAALAALGNYVDLEPRAAERGKIQALMDALKTRLN